MSFIIQEVRKRNDWILQQGGRSARLLDGTTFQMAEGERGQWWTGPTPLLKVGDVVKVQSSHDSEPCDKLVADVHQSRVGGSLLQQTVRFA